MTHPGEPDHDPVHDPSCHRIEPYDPDRDDVQWPDDGSEHCCMTGVPHGD